MQPTYTFLLTYNKLVSFLKINYFIIQQAFNEIWYTSGMLYLLLELAKHMDKNIIKLFYLYIALSTKIILQFGIKFHTITRVYGPKLHQDPFLKKYQLSALPYSCICFLFLLFYLKKTLVFFFCFFLYVDILHVFSMANIVNKVNCWIISY